MLVQHLEPAPVIVLADGGFLTRLLLHEENLGVFLGCSGHLTHQLVLFSTNERLEARLSLNCLQSSLACFIRIQALASIILISERKLWRADSCRSPAPPGRSHCIDTNSLPRHVGIGNLVLSLTSHLDTEFTKNQGRGMGNIPYQLSISFSSFCLKKKNRKVKRKKRDMRSSVVNS